MRIFRIYEQGYALHEGKMVRVMVLKQNAMRTQVTLPDSGGPWSGVRKGRVKSVDILPLPSTNSWCGSV